jgi:short subunit dehydrogenase-like uncharacterized protein
MITLLAATGYTGQLISQQLVKRDIEFQIAGRSMEKLRALAAKLGRPKMPAHHFDAMDMSTYDAALKDAKVLINCAGPFTELGMNVVGAAAQRGIHYLDTTGEQSFIKQSAEKFHAAAQQNGCALMSACAFEFALGDAGAAFAARPFQQCDEIALFYIIGGFGASRGTKKSVIQAILNPSYFYRDNSFAQISAAAEQRIVDAPNLGPRNLTSFGGGEVISVPRHVKTRNVSTYINIASNPTMLKLGMTILIPLLKTPLRKLLDSLIDRQGFGPDENERNNTSFTIICQASCGDKKNQAIITGKDPYGLTAIIAAETARRLLDVDHDINGATSAAAAFGPEMVQKITEPAGVAWQI